MVVVHPFPLSFSQERSIKEFLAERYQSDGLKSEERLVTEFVCSLDFLADYEV